jgi:hypothetical protein
MREQYGERETVSRAARRVLRSYKDWGVLSETDKKGIYGQGLSLAIDEPELVSWLIEASLHARENGAAPVKDIIGSPSLFPFRIAQIGAISSLTVSSRLELLRHGLDDDLILLPKQVPK